MGAVGAVGAGRLPYAATGRLGARLTRPETHDPDVEVQPYPAQMGQTQCGRFNVIRVVLSAFTTVSSTAGDRHTGWAASVSAAPIRISTAAERRVVGHGDGMATIGW